MTGLRGEAAIVGIAELPARNGDRARRPSFTLDQYALLAKLVIEDAGVERRCGERPVVPRTSRSRTCSRPPRCPNISGIPIDFGDRVDLGGATSAGMVWRAAAAVELGICDAVLAVVPGSREIPRSQRRPAPQPGLVRGVEQQLRVAAGGVRDPVRQRRPERSVRADRATLRAPNTATIRRLWRRSRWTSGPTPCAHPARCSTASRSPWTTC